MGTYTQIDQNGNIIQIITGSTILTPPSGTTATLQQLNNVQPNDIQVVIGQAIAGTLQSGYNPTVISIPTGSTLTGQIKYYQSTSTTGSLGLSMILIGMNNFTTTGTTTITYPFAFPTFRPMIIPDAGLTTAIGTVVQSITNSTITLKGSNTTGYILLIGI